MAATDALPHFDAERDLVLERTTDLPRSLLWKAWTTPEHLVHWFTPAPWKTVECEIDLRPGGIDLLFKGGVALLWIAAGMTLWTGWDYLMRSLPHLKDG